MATTIGFIGQKVTLVIKQGATLGPFSVLLRDKVTLLPIDMSGSAVRGQIRKKALDAVAIVAFDVSVTNTPTESFNWGLTDEATALITAGEAGLTDPASIYVYDLEWEDSLGAVLPLLYGPVQVYREVTRP